MFSKVPRYFKSKGFFFSFFRKALRTADCSSACMRAGVLRAYLCVSAWIGTMMRCTSVFSLFFFAFLCHCVSKNCYRGLFLFCFCDAKLPAGNFASVLHCKMSVETQMPYALQPPWTPPSSSALQKELFPPPVWRGDAQLFMFSHSNWKLWLFPGRLSHFDEARRLQFAWLAPHFVQMKIHLMFFQIQMNDSLTSILKLKWVSTHFPFLLILFKEERHWLCVGYY